jgi:hypothetical protein
LIKIGEKSYYFSKICLNGHVLFNNLEHLDKTQEFCQECGKKIITCCENCNNPIRGDLYIPDVDILEQSKAPVYCYACGSPLPWTRAGIDALEEFINFENNLSKDEKEKLKKSIGDIITETPRSQFASMLFKLALTKMGKETGKGVRDLLFKIGTDKVRDSISAQINLS